MPDIEEEPEVGSVKEEGPETISSNGVSEEVEYREEQMKAGNHQERHLEEEDNEDCMIVETSPELMMEVKKTEAQKRDKEAERRERDMRRREKDQRRKEKEERRIQKKERRTERVRRWVYSGKVFL